MVCSGFFGGEVEVWYVVGVVWSESYFGVVLWVIQIYWYWWGCILFDKFLKFWFYYRQG